MRYAEYANVTDLPVRAAEGSPLALPPEARGTAWVDALRCDTATPLAVHDPRVTGAGRR